MAIVEIIKKDLFDEKNQIIGHGVNTKGYMGAGIALVFKRKYPENFLEYKEHCKSERLQPGKVFSYTEKNRTILNIASQDFPGPFARIEWIKSALDEIHSLGYEEICLPWIGCGIGGLKREDVLQVLKDSSLKKITVCEVD